MVVPTVEAGKTAAGVGEFSTSSNPGRKVLIGLLRFKTGFSSESRFQEVFLAEASYSKSAKSF